MLARGDLLVEENDQNRFTLTPRGEITVGRSADFPVGADDPAMHRRFLHIWNSAGDWLIQNVGNQITAKIHPEGNIQFIPQRLAPVILRTYRRVGRRSRGPQSMRVTD